MSELFSLNFRYYYDDLYCLIYNELFSCLLLDEDDKFLLLLLLTLYIIDLSFDEFFSKLKFLKKGLDPYDLSFLCIFYKIGYKLFKE